MRLERVEGADDPRLETYREVRDPAWLGERGFFLAEGRQVVRALLDAQGRFLVRSLLVTEVARRALAGALERAPEQLPVYEVSKAVMTATSGVRFHQGCVAAASLRAEATPQALLASARLVLVLADLTDPDNVGSAFRNAAAFGADGVLLSPRCAWPLYRKAVRTSLGATLRVPFATLEPFPEALERVRAAGIELLALDPGGECGLSELEPAPRVALLLGNEGEGLAPAALAYASRSVRIEMAPGMDSLNVAAAAALALYHVARRSPGTLR